MSSGRVAPVYLPFAGGEFRLRMGLTPVPPQEWLERDAKLAAALARKRELLETRHREVFQVLPEATAAARELLDLLAAHLCLHHRAHFRSDGSRLHNIATGEIWELATPALHPLDIAG